MAHDLRYDYRLHVQSLASPIGQYVLEVCFQTGSADDSASSRVVYRKKGVERLLVIKEAVLTVCMCWSIEPDYKILISSQRQYS